MFKSGPCKKVSPRLHPNKWDQTIFKSGPARGKKQTNGTMLTITGPDVDEKSKLSSLAKCGALFF